MSPRVEMLRWQFDLTWRLAGYHIPLLTDDACLWEPAPGSWTVRRDANGIWHADWSDKEPDPAPPVTISWLMWQMIWWWSSARAVLRDKTPAAREKVVWPGSADGAKRELDTLAKDWSEILSRLGESDLTFDPGPAERVCTQRGIFGEHIPQRVGNGLPVLGVERLLMPKYVNQWLLDREHG